MRGMKFVLSLAAVTFILVVVGSPVLAQSTDHVDDLVVLTGRVDVPVDQKLKTVVIFDGPATIEGTVRQQVVAFNGDVRVGGTVENDVVALNGRVTVTDGGRVDGDVVSQRSAVVEPGATVGGDVRRFDPRMFEAWFSVVTRLAWWLVVSLSALVLGLVLLWLAPRAAEATLEAVRTTVGSVIGWGLVALVGGPIAAGILMVTLVGIPLGLYALALSAVVSVLGYVTSAWIVGRRLVREPGRRGLAFLAGLAVLRVIALVPFLAGLVWVAGAVFGTGALAVALWRARGANIPVAATPAQP